MKLACLTNAFFSLFMSILAGFRISVSSSSWKPVCGYPGRPAHGFTVPAQTGFAEGDSVRFFCEPLRYLLGSSHRRCTADGTWKGSLPFCVKSTPAASHTWNVTQHLDIISDSHDDTCAGVDVFPIRFASRRRDILAVNIKLKIPIDDTIDAASQPQPHNFTVTTANQNEIHKCEYSSKSCGDPDAPLNAVVKRRHRHSATYKCLHGEPLSGDITRVCTRSTWTGTVPSCPASTQNERYNIVFLSLSFTFNVILTCLVVGLFIQVYRFMQMRKQHLCSISSNNTNTTRILLNDTYNPMGSVFITEDNYDVPSDDLMVSSRRTSRLPSASTGGRPSLSSSGHHNSTPSNGNVFPDDDYSCCSINNIDATSGDGALHIYAEIPEGILPILPRQRIPPPNSEPPVDVNAVYSEPVDEIDSRGESRVGIYTEPYGSHAEPDNSVKS